jgi:ELP3 family radical SAM enzyme/protein acetyltransferase
MMSACSSEIADIEDIGGVEEEKYYSANEEYFDETDVFDECFNETDVFDEPIVNDNNDMNSLISTFADHNIHITDELTNFFNDLYEIYLQKFNNLNDSNDSITRNDLQLMIRDMRRLHHISPKMAHLSYIYKVKVSNNEIRSNNLFEYLLKIKTVRELSGVLVVTVFMSDRPFGQEFTCQWDCSFCPSEPGQPKSYLSDEPGVQRGKRNNFDPYLQFMDRVRTHWINGHPIDKIEILILGGTYSSYPEDYRVWFITSLIYAANIGFDTERRGMLSLEEEIAINETTRIRMIGITIETRPDTINNNLLLELRRLNVTRIQMGVQHTNDAILHRNKRGHLLKHTIRGIQLAMDSGFKVDIHLMPNLPGSSLKEDRIMLCRYLSDVRLQGDQLKMYPCQVTPYTKIEEEYNNGSYVPYDANEMFELILFFKTKIHEWLRINRMVRDFPSQYDLAGNIVTSMRQDLHTELLKRNLVCKCIRCSEVRDNTSDIDNAELVVRHIESTDGILYTIDGVDNYFISFESNINKRVLYGFLRLRITNNANTKIFPELTSNNPVALIRELHVYGTITPVNTFSNKNTVQHCGFGRQLLAKAEEIALTYNCDIISIISGIGVRKYYERNGYTLQGIGQFMIKNI